MFCLVQYTIRVSDIQVQAAGTGAQGASPDPEGGGRRGIVRTQQVQQQLVMDQSPLLFIWYY